MQPEDLKHHPSSQTIHLHILENHLNIEIICPKCSSHNYYNRGVSKQGQKQYSCVDCKRFFVIQPLCDKEGREIICPDCQSRHYKRDGKVLEKQRYKCNDCSRKFILDPYNRGDLESVVCRWCGGNNFRRKGIYKPTGKLKCYCLDCERQFTVGATANRDCLKAPEEFDFENDVWTAKHLGYEDGIHYHNKLNFSGINQYWLKRQFKKFILYLSRTRIEFSTLIGKISYTKHFSKYLEVVGYYQEFSGINRSLIIDFLVFLKTSQFSYSNTIHTLSTLKTFFETGVLNDWFYVEPTLIRPEDWPKKHKRMPRFIPEEVMTQLNHHLDALPEPVMRMALVHIE
jgi:integrase/recombinase XerD